MWSSVTSGRGAPSSIHPLDAGIPCHTSGTPLFPPSHSKMLCSSLFSNKGFMEIKNSGQVHDFPSGDIRGGRSDGVRSSTRSYVHTEPRMGWTAGVADGTSSLWRRPKKESTT